MRLVRRIVAGLLGLFRMTRAEQELDEELQDFVAAAIDEKMRAGLSRASAARAARLELGSAAAIKDRVRDVGWESGVERLWQDLRYASRSLRKSSGLTAVTILTLGLGIGAATAIFQLADAVRLRPLPVAHPEPKSAWPTPRAAVWARSPAGAHSSPTPCGTSFVSASRRSLESWRGVRIP